MRDVFIVGVGMTEFGELWEKALRELITEAGLEAVQDAGVRGPDIDAMYVASASAGRLLGQQQLGVLALDEAGLAGHHVPATRIEAGDASGAAALRSAALAVASGAHDVVVAGGVEKMTDVLEDDATRALASSADMEWEGFFGATLPALYAMMARSHAAEHGTTRDQLAHVAVKNHEHGADNPDAAFPFTTSLESVKGSPPVSDPIRMFDCASPVDGAAALVLADRDTAEQLGGPRVQITATAQASDALALHRRDAITELASSQAAAEEAFAETDHGPEDVDLAELHDVYTIAELISLESLGFYEPGMAATATVKGRTTHGGDLVVNPSGGLKARGHALGATGLAQAAEVAAQIRRDAGERQVEDAQVGLTQAVAGTGGTSIVHVLEGGGEL
ncbi:acetyl-CoA acetyltransferase [Thermoplasmatales archaeon SW_10_69_26]|jgi:acetyl-CoA C-acetyltransferase|nr:MAG: acetyl-CoA acetyltransferase [Thermoplasmatales archaeon SW_10_69_26]